jgi:malonyl-CoA O-methyltransferase
VSLLDRAACQRLTPQKAGSVILDAGCGIGRRLAELPQSPEVRAAVGLDLVPAMLHRAPRRHAPFLVAGDLRSTPFRPRTFDLLWCRLVLGHLPELQPAYDEFRRVAGRDACLIVTDFHPTAAERGHTRTFRDVQGRLHSVEHHVHGVDDHRRAARTAGWHPDQILDMTPGPEFAPRYAARNAAAHGAADADIPLVLAMRFWR